MKGCFWLSHITLKKRVTKLQYATLIMNFCLNCVKCRENTSFANRYMPVCNCVPRRKQTHLRPKNCAVKLPTSMATPSTLPNFFEKYRTASRRHHQRFCQAPPHSLTALFRGALFVTCATPFQRQLFYQSAPRTVRIQQFTLRQPPVVAFCVLHPVSRVLWTVFCVLCPASGFTPCASRSYLLCPLIIAQRPLCIAPSCRLCICCTFSVITISDILPQSNSESRSHVPCPALRVLRLASCVLRPTSDYALCSLCSYLHVLYLLSLCLPCATSCTVPHFSVTTVYPAVWQFQALRPVFFAATASNIICRKSLRQQNRRTQTVALFSVNG